MPSRLTDETRSLVSEAFGVHGFGDRRISHTLFARDRAPKRRKADNLNSRFDRMIHAVNVMHTPAAREPKRRRRTSSTSGSSSLAGWDAPPTPDAYTEAGQGSTVGRGKGRVERNKRYEGMQDPELHFFEEGQAEQEEVPTWLSSTVAALQSNHPLRDLIPADNAHISSENVQLHQVDPPHAAPVEEEVFAFLPPSPQPQSTAFEEPVPYAVLDPVEDFEHDASSTRFPALIHPEPLRHVPSPAPPFAHPSHALPQLPGPPAGSHPIRAHRVSSPAHSAHFSSAVVTDAGIAVHPPRYQPSPTLDSPVVYDLADSMLHSPPFSKPGPLAPSPIPAARLPVYLPRIMSPCVPDLAHPMPLPFSTPGPLAIGAARPRRIFDGVEDSSSSVLSHAHSSLQPDTRASQVHQSRLASNPNARLDALPVLDSPLPPSDPESLSSPVPTHLLRRPVLPPRQTRVLGTVKAPNLFSTPGPAARVYFDSPIEDPVGSDPLGPDDYELDLDYANLDFRWEKFERGELPTTPLDRPRQEFVDESGVPHQPERPLTLALKRDRSVATTDDEISPDKHPQLENDAQSIALPGTPDRHSNTGDDDPIPRDNEPAVPEIHAAEERSVRRPAFAPAPGIYISPLRGSSSSADKTGEDNQMDESALSRVTETAVEEHEILEFSLPRTPTKPVVDTIHTPLRKSGRQRIHSLPPIAVLPRTPSRDSIQDPEPSLSQASNDTIESWSAP